MGIRGVQPNSTGARAAEYLSAIPGNAGADTQVLAFALQVDYRSLRALLARAMRLRLIVNEPTGKGRGKPVLWRAGPVAIEQRRKLEVEAAAQAVRDAIGDPGEMPAVLPSTESAPDWFSTWPKGFVSQLSREDRRKRD